MGVLTQIFDDYRSNDISKSELFDCLIDRSDERDWELVFDSLSEDEKAEFRAMVVPLVTRERMLISSSGTLLSGRELASLRRRCEQRGWLAGWPVASLLPLNDTQRKWIADCVSQARILAQKYRGTVELGTLGPPMLDEAFTGWFAKWQAGAAREDPTMVANCVGLAFGQCLVERLAMQWAVISDGNGTGIGVFFGPPLEQVRLFPVRAVAESLEAKEPASLQALFELIQAQVADIAGSTSVVSKNPVGSKNSAER